MLAIVEGTDNSSSVGGGTETIQYLTPDHLGSPRLITDRDGVVINRRDFYPFGEEIGAGIGGRMALGYGTDSIKQRFTGYFRDNETGLDFAQARYYGSMFGRFMSPDPFDPILTGNVDILNDFILDPQKLNKYSYGMNNPLKYIDKDGESPTLVTAAIGAAVGFAVGFGIELGRQVVSEEKADYGRLFGAGVKGAVIGGIAGLTAGTSLLVSAGAGAGASVLGGVAGRSTEVIINNGRSNRDLTENFTETVFDAKSIIYDGIAGAVGGAANYYAERAIISIFGSRIFSNTQYLRAVRSLRNNPGSSTARKSVDVIQSKVGQFLPLLDQARKARGAGAFIATQSLNLLFGNPRKEKEKKTYDCPTCKVRLVE